MPTQAKMAPSRYARLIKGLVEGEYNCRELADLSDLGYITVLDYCRALHEEKQIHIVKWERDAIGRDSIMVYKFGPGEDAPKRRLTRAEQQQRYRARKQADEVEHRERRQERYVPPLPPPVRTLNIHDLTNEEDEDDV